MVEEDSPVKQGLKHMKPIIIDDRKNVEEDSPVKQGLKLFRVC